MSDHATTIPADLLGKRLATKPAGWADRVLSFDVFAGDFGDGSERELLNDLAIAKRGGRCRECAQPVRKGEITRRIKMADNEGFYGGRVCEACCAAMAASDEDGGEGIEARFALHLPPVTT